MDKKQFFNKHPNGLKITWAAGKGVEVVQINYGTVKHSAFPIESWKIFCEGINISVQQMIFLFFRNGIVCMDIFKVFLRFHC